MSNTVDDLNSEEDLMAWRGQKKRSGGKYHAQKITVGGYDFDSKSEARFYTDWIIPMHMLGEITRLEEPHPEFILQEKFTTKWGKRIQEIKYTADFQFVWQDRYTVVIDVKGSAKVVSRDFPLRAKLFQAKYPDMRFFVVDMSKFDPDFLIKVDTPKKKRVK